MDRSPNAKHAPIVDAHHHFWDLDRNYHPWLCDEPLIPFRYGDYGPLRQNYLPENYFKDASPFDLILTHSGDDF